MSEGSIPREELGLSQEELGVEESEPLSLEEALKNIFDPNFSTFGHGTRLEAAKQILMEGLKAKYPGLDTTAISLFDGSRPFDEQVSRVVDTITHWPHLDAKALVVVMIPNKPEGLKVGVNEYFNSVFQRTGEVETGYNTPYVIPQHYIRGIIDVEGRRFIPNPTFKPEIPKISPKKTGLPSRDSRLLVIPNVPTPSAKGSSSGDDVW